MLWFLLLGVMVAIFALLYWSGKRFRPENIARNAARTMLATYCGLEAARPETSKEQLYAETLKLRTTVSDPNSLKKVMEDAKQTAQEMNQPVRLWMVTLWVVMHEYHAFRSKTTSVPGNIPHPIEFYEQFRKGILEVIPEDV